MQTNIGTGQAPNFARNVPYSYSGGAVRTNARSPSREASPTVYTTASAGARNGWKNMPLSPAKATHAPASALLGLPTHRPVAANFVPPLGNQDTTLVSPRRSPARRNTSPRRRSSSDVSRAFVPQSTSITYEQAPGFVHHYSVADRAQPSPSGGSAPPAPPASSAPTTPRLGAYQTRDREATVGVPSAGRVVVERTGRLEAENADLRARLEECENDLFAEQRRRGELEAKHLELQASSNVRVLEGKVAGLQAMLEEKSRDHEKSLSQQSNLQIRLEDSTAKVAHLNGVIEELENRAGHQHVRMQELERELEKERNTIHSLEETLEDQYKKMQRQKQVREDDMAERENQEAEMRAELRLKNRQLQDGEMEKLSYSEESQNLRCELEEAANRLRAQDKALQDMRDRCEDAERRIEQCHGEEAQMRVVADGLKKELERENMKVRNMLSDLRAAECQRIELEERVRQTEQELKRLRGVEENAKYLEDSLQRAEEDVRSEVKQHSETRQRLREAEERLQDAQALHQQLAQAEAELAAKAESVERMHETMERHASKVNALQAELEAERKSAAAVGSDLAASIEHQRAMEARMAELEAEAQRASEFDAKVRSYEELLQARAEELRQANAELSKSQIAIRELEHRLQEINELDARVQALLREKQEAEHELGCQQRALARCEQDKSNLAHQLDSGNYALESERNMTRELQRHVEDLHQKLQQKATLDVRIREMEQELQDRTRELSEERASLGSHVSRCRHLESDLEGALDRQRVLEENFQKQTATLEALQMEMGKQSVSATEHQREASRLSQEISDVESQLSDTREALTRTKEQYDQQTVQVNALQQAEAHLTTSGDSLRDELSRLSKELAEKSRALEMESERTRALQGKMVTMEAEAVRCNTLEGQVQALQEVNEAKTRELDSLQTQVTALRTQLSTAEESSAQSAQMEARIRDLRAQLSQQLADMERLEADESRKAAALAESRKELERLSDSLRAKERLVEEECSRNAATGERVQRLEAAAAARSSLEGKIAGLEILAESKEAELRTVSDEAAALRQRVRDLEQELQGRARVEDVMQEAQMQLQIKNDAIARLELEERKRRAAVGEQHNEILSLNEKVRLTETRVQEQTTKRLEAEARVQELSRESELRTKSDESENRERLMLTERLEAECRETRDRLLGAERAARLSEQRQVEAQNEAQRMRLLLQRLEDGKGCLATEASELRQQLNAERIAVQRLQTDVATLESELRMQKDREERTARSMGDDIREAKQRYEAKIASLEQRLFETESMRDAMEKECSKLREELSYLNNTLRSKSLQSGHYEPYAPSGSAMQLPPPSDTASVRESEYETDLRNREDRLASEWERTKESVSRLKLQLRHG